VELHEAAEFELFDSSGKLLKSISINPGMTNAVLNTGDINDGLFIYRIHTSEGQLQAGKLIIQH
ncbi:MAG: T9SS type A sorting domain-containing protein, partial [Saprospiraceae bacterium]